MTVLSSAIDTRSDTFKKNAQAMRALVADLRSRTDKVRLGGGEESRKRHVARGKLLPRERVRSLLDPGSPFLELSPLAAMDMYDNEAPGSGVIGNSCRSLTAPIDRFATNTVISSAFSRAPALEIREERKTDHNRPNVPL